MKLFGGTNMCQARRVLDVNEATGAEMIIHWHQLHIA